MSLRVHMRAALAAVGLCSHAGTVVQNFSTDLSNEKGDTVGETLSVLGFDPARGTLLSVEANFAGTISAPTIVLLLVTRLASIETVAAIHWQIEPIYMSVKTPK